MTAIDNVSDYWPAGMTNRHWPVMDVDITKPDNFTDTFDATTCVSGIRTHPEPSRSDAPDYRTSEAGRFVDRHVPLQCARTVCEDVCRRPDVERTGPPHPYICQSFAADNLQTWLDLGLTLVASEDLGDVYRSSFSNG